MPHYLLDNNILNYACRDVTGSVINNINSGIEQANLIGDQKHTTIAITPFSLLEALGVTWKDINVKIPSYTGSQNNDVGEYIWQIAGIAEKAFSKLPQLQPEYLMDRSEDRRSFVAYPATTLYDYCVHKKVEGMNVTGPLAKTLGMDFAFKYAYPKNIRKEADFFLFLTALSTDSVPTMSMFRIVKRFWDLFYSTGKMTHNSEFLVEIEAVNKSMRLKTKRDFLDCDLIHLACFGWGDSNLTVFTCDSPEVVLHRISVYKGMFLSFLGAIEHLEFPKDIEMNHGKIACCDADGVITHLIPTKNVPALG